MAGPQYPESISWPENVERIVHIEPRDHRAFYNAQRFTLNVTRADMIRTGYSPSVRLFEAAACGTPIISDSWPGLGDFFTPEEEADLTRVVKILQNANYQGYVTLEYESAENPKVAVPRHLAKLKELLRTA